MVGSAQSWAILLCFRIACGILQVIELVVSAIAPPMGLGSVSTLEMGLIVVGWYPLRWGVMACQFQGRSRSLSMTPSLRGEVTCRLREK